MRAISLPPTPYDATAQRPSWASLPEPVRAAVAERLGAPVLDATPGRGGFTLGFAAVLRTADGQRAFVKVADLSRQPHLADWFAREAAVAAALPAIVRAPRARWTLAAAGHFVLCLDPIDGHIPTLPWRPEELSATLAAWGTAAQALRQPQPGLLALGLPRLADLLRADLSNWQEIAAGRAPMPPAGRAPMPPAGAEAAAGWSPAAHLRELVALEKSLPGYADTTAITHCDLRVDNVLIDSSGDAWLVDWNWLCLGAQWFDTAALLVTAYASGLDADTLFAAHPTAAGTPPDALDAALAALAGHWLCGATEPALGVSTHLPGHKRWSGQQALSWLAARRCWPSP